MGRDPAGQAVGLRVPYGSTTRMGYVWVLLRVGSGDLQLDKGGLYALEIEAKLLVRSDWPFSACAYPGLVFISLDHHPSADPRLRKIANSLYRISLPRTPPLWTRNRHRLLMGIIISFSGAGLVTLSPPLPARALPSVLSTPLTYLPGPRRQGTHSRRHQEAPTAASTSHDARHHRRCT
jgi:hypothetical protein